MKNTEINIRIENDKLTKYGENSAAKAHVRGSVRGSARAAAALSTLRRLEEMRDESRSEWLLDNMYIARSRTRAAAEQLRRAGRLRRLDSGETMVEYAARCLVQAGGGRVDGERIALFLEGFQKNGGLTEKELGLFRPVLECRLLGYLSKDAARAEAVFKTLSFTGTADISPVLESASILERRLREDPAGIYPRMDKDSRAMYRHELARAAKKQGISEDEAGRRAVERARAAAGEKRHVGRYIRPQRKKPYAAYIGANVLLTLLAAAAVCAAAKSLWIAAAVILPAGEAVKYITDRIAARLIKPRALPRLDYSGGIPPESRTLCVTAVLLSSPRAALQCAGKLERYRLANRDAGKELVMGMLADLPESKREAGPDDDETVRAAAAEIRRLNEKYSGGFCLILRKRRYSERDRLYRGWERKRGAIMELTDMLRGESNSARLVEGSAGELENISYLIVLDADTDLAVGSAAKLAATIAHPMQRPEVKDGRTVSGCGIIQPKIGVALEDAGRSDFARIFAGQGGLDPYGSVNSDVYQDLFGEASYNGKGIMSVDALRACLGGRIPPNTLLSHDMIEGSYLGCAYAGDIELTDGFPAGLLPYFDRQHRWIRGDWQTLPWLGRKVRDESGKKVNNPISPCAKWKIFDNIRRSLVPVSGFVTLFLCALLGGRALVCASIAVLVCLAVKVIVNSLRPDMERKKYRSSVLSSACADFMQLLMLVILLPYSAYISACAAASALIRMYITHKNMLQWVTAAESSEKGKDSLRHYYARMAVCPVAGAAGLALTPSPPAMALFILWMLAPLIAFYISREKKSGAAASEDERLFLLHCAADIWRYFDRLLAPERNWLPPDNYQEEPGKVTAERTSPTNIGLALLAALAAADLGLCTRQRSDELMSHILDTLERMPKFRGNLYNWYDITKLEPMKPEYVSTVDSGNLVCSLIVLAQADRPEISQRAEKLAREMRLDFLYDRERKLFRIGWDAAQDAPSGGWYDLMESEARMTSYAAVARGEAEPRHWRRLGRILTDCGGVSGLASWTGTMFEYFMPALILPYYKDSLLWESMELCFKAQRRRSRIWGISESAFAAFDAAMNYSYKAHGVQSIALKRGMDRDLVVSPYSTFIALPMNIRAAVSNLKRLRAMGMEGEYGFYEALDMTDGVKRVKCFMAHHLAMSLIAVDNALCGGIMRQRFIRDAEMGAYTGLLSEKCPVGRPIRTDADYRAEEKPERPAAIGKWSSALTGASLARPACWPISNGRYSVVADELGRSRSMLGDVLIAAYEPGRISENHGILFFLSCGNAVIPLQAAPEYGMQAEHSSEYADGRVRLYTGAAGWDSCVDIGVLPGGMNGELREVTLKNTGRETRQAELGMYFEPALARRAEYRAHPAFSKLRIESGYENGCLIFSRRESEDTVFLAVAADKKFSFDTDKSGALGRGGLRALPRALLRPAGGSLGGGPEPCALIRVPVTVKAGEKLSVRFVLCAADSAALAAETAARALKKGGRDEETFRLAAKKYSPEAALELMPDLIYRTQGKGLTAPELLWSFGISGDYPVLAARFNEHTAPRLLEGYGFLKRMGYDFDLALIFRDTGEYDRPSFTDVSGRIASMGLAGYVGARAGIHLISGDEKETARLLSAAASPRQESRRTDEKAAGAFFMPTDGENRVRREYGWLDESFFALTKTGIGETAWSSVISNGAMGWLATDSLSGGMWLGNARENRLNRWLNDPLATLGTERLEVIRRGERVSLCADGDRYGCRFEYGFGRACWEKNIDGLETRVTGFIPPEKNCRILLIELKGYDKGDRLSYFTQYESKFKISCAPEPELLFGDELEYLTQGAAKGGRPCFAAAFAPAERIMICAGEEVGDIEQAYRLLSETGEYWHRLTSTVRIKTPCPKLDRYMNGWALYQILACRMWARSSLYQSGGAFGFRDQLQDACALIDVMPELARSHILLCAAHQYAEGDVMHWWHPGKQEKGVRTRCSDDLLWLPYAAALYAEKTGDTGIFGQKAPWLVSQPLEEGEKDRYEQVRTQGEDSLREHCLRAMRLVLERGRGSHGLLYMGSGDWNDGFDAVGEKGESVWLTWFAAMVMKKWPEFAARAEELGRAADRAFDAGQYIRGYYGSGQALGAEGNAECAIDSIAQSFAVLSGCGTHGSQAVDKAVDKLFDGPGRPVRLFDPPFRGIENPGYIMNYLPGVRENGGQYTHAAVWLASACLRLGKTDTGWSLLHSLLPTTKDEEIYKEEPYVLAADVYTNESMYGRAGWSWYTGAAGWFYRTVIEELLGIRMENSEPRIEPALPSSWDGYEADYAGWHIRAEKNNGRWEVSKARL